MSSLTPLTFIFSYDEKQFTRTATCGPNEVVTSASTSFPNSGVNVSWSGGTFTVSGTFRKIFPESTWTYIPKYDIEKDPVPEPVTVTTRSTDSTIAAVPAEIYEFISGTHETRLEQPITYTVNTRETLTGYNTAYGTTPDGGSYSYQVPYTYYANHTYTINHKVCNNWDIFKNQLIELISRGSK